MTREQKIRTVRTLSDNADEALIKVYLDIASDRILKRLYPHGAIAGVTVPEEHALTVCELAARMILRRGGEGETAHGENGISRTYDSVDDADILNRVVPYAKII